MAKLNTNVHVVEVDADGQPGRSGSFGPGDELPDWAVKAITNPDVWEGDAPPKHAGSGVRTVGAPDSMRARAEEAERRAAAAEAELAKLREQIQGNTESEGDAPQEPPRGGAGSGADAWRTFLTGQGVEDLPENASREDLVALWDTRKNQA